MASNLARQVQWFSETVGTAPLIHLAPSPLTKEVVGFFVWHSLYGSKQTRASSKWGLSRHSKHSDPFNFIKELKWFKALSNFGIIVKISHVYAVYYIEILAFKSWLSYDVISVMYIIYHFDRIATMYSVVLHTLALHARSI